MVAEAVRLVGADGGVLYLVEGDGGTLRLARDAGITGALGSRWARGLRLPAGSGMVGRAVAERRVQVTRDYPVDPSIAHAPATDRIVAEVGIRSMVVAPLVSGARALGALGVFSGRPDAFAEAQTALVRALAGHAAVTLSNDRLIAELAESRAEVARRAETERTLRELGARLASTRGADELLRAVVLEAGRLVHADATILALLGPDGRLHWGLDDGLRDRFDPAYVEELTLEVGVGVTGRAIAERRVVICNHDLLNAFPRTPESDHFFEVSGARSMIAAPIVGEAGPLGALEVYAGREGAFGEADGTLLQTFADQAAAAIATTRLIDELRRSRRELERRAETERTLREIAGRLAALRDPADVLQHAVEAVTRLVRADWSAIAEVDAAGRIQWTYDAGIMDPAVRDALRAVPGQVGAGLLGRAAAEGRVLATGDYLADDSFGHTPAADAFARQVGFRSLVAAPMSREGSVIGLLGVHSARPDAFDAEDVTRIAALADHAAVAMANARLLDRLRLSESRYRGLLEASPDIVFTVDEGGTFTYLSETIERQLGWAPGELVGSHFSTLIDEASMGTALDGWRALQETPGAIVARRFDLVSRGGRRVPYDVRSFGLVRDGAFLGVQGSARDVSAQVTLEHELRESERRYRTLVQSSPDGVWDADANGIFTFWSERAASLYGWPPEEIVGRHWSTIVAPEAMDAAMPAWASLSDGGDRLVRVPLALVHAAGRIVPSEVSAVPVFEDGRFAGAHGVVRDVSERERLERELRDSEARYRYLVENSPDVVWSADADGTFTYLSETSERLLGWRPDDLVGRRFSTVVHPESVEFAERQFADSAAGGPPSDLQYRFIALHRDGTRVPVEMHARTIVEGGMYRGAHGAVRDVRDRERLERDLRRQAAELAANEERAHLARELHDSVTQALFSMTLVTRSVELLLAKDPAAAAAKLDILRELQRDALAEMRALIFELRPASLETEGLVAALRTHAAAVQGRTGIAIVIEADEMDRLPAEQEMALYRVAQEALHNVVKHAAAREVHIAVERRDGHVRLLVEDDGVGFDPGAVPAGHLGLAGMRARLEKEGGTLAIRSAPGSGTAVEATLVVGVRAGQ